MKLKVNLFVSMCIGTDDINIADAVRLPEGRKDPRSSYPSKFRLGPHAPARHGPPCVRPSGWSRRRGAVVARAAVARAARVGSYTVAGSRHQPLVLHFQGIPGAFVV